MYIKLVKKFTNDLFFPINVRHFHVLEMLHFSLNQVWKSNLVNILHLYLHSNEEEQIVKLVEIKELQHVEQSENETCAKKFVA